MDAKVRTILAATDFSPAASAAVRRAALVARAHDAKLELVHVLAAPNRVAASQPLQAELGRVRDDLRRLVVKDLQALAAQIEAEIGVRAQVVVAEGKPFAEIAARSESIPIASAAMSSFMVSLHAVGSQRLVRQGDEDERRRADHEQEDTDVEKERCWAGEPPLSGENSSGPCEK